VKALWGASPKPGVPAEVSTGGAEGLPERPREGRGGFEPGVFGGDAMGRNMARRAPEFKCRLPVPCLYRAEQGVRRS
jgi:hypothetical protein